MVDDGYYQDSMNSVLQTLLSAVKLYTTCRHGHYLCREEVKKGSMPYDAWCNLSPSGSRDVQCEDSRQSLPIARVSG